MVVRIGGVVLVIGGDGVEDLWYGGDGGGDLWR